MVVDYLSMSSVNFAIPDFCSVIPVGSLRQSRRVRNRRVTHRPCLVMGSRPCGSDDLKLMNRQVQVRWHRSPHFGSAACSQGSAPWSRWKCAQEETGSVRVHLLPGGTDEHTFCGDRAEVALLGHS